MIIARIDEKKSLPLWATLGAPLVGMPMLVAFLALVAPTEPSAEMGLDEVIRVEHEIDADMSNRPLDLESVDFQRDTRQG